MRNRRFLILSATTAALALLAYVAFINQPLAQPSDKERAMIMRESGMGSGPGGAPAGAPGTGISMPGAATVSAEAYATATGTMTALSVKPLSAPQPAPLKAAASVPLSPDQTSVVKDTLGIPRAAASQVKPAPLSAAKAAVPAQAFALALIKSAQLSRGVDLSSQTFYNEDWALAASSTLDRMQRAHPSFPARQLVMAAELRADWEVFFWRWSVGEMLKAPTNKALVDLAADAAASRIALNDLRRMVSVGLGKTNSPKAALGQRTDTSLNRIANLISQGIAPAYDPANLRFDDNARSPLMLMLADRYLQQGHSWWVDRSYSGTQWPPTPTAGWPAAGFVAEQASINRQIETHITLNQLFTPNGQAPTVLPTAGDIKAYSEWLTINPSPTRCPLTSEQFAAYQNVLVWGTTAK